MTEGIKGATIWGKIVAAFIGGSLITGLGVAVYFLRLSNDQLEERLQDQNSLIRQVEEAQAEGERLKAEALENNVFLGNPSQ